MTMTVPYRSIPDMFLSRVRSTPDARALGYPQPGGGVGWLTWRQVRDQASAIAAGLRGLGVGSEDRVAIASDTRVEWVLADLGIMCAGAATTTVYPTTEPGDAAYILADSGSSVLIAENPDQVAKVADADLPQLRHIVLIDGEPDKITARVPVMSLKDLETRGAAVLAEQPDLVTDIIETIEPDHLATLIYTSGTTGRPKGVELLHGGWCWQAAAQSELGLLVPEDLQYLWLPLSHSFGKTLLCGLIHVGLPTYVDGRQDKIIDNLGAIRPTLMCAAPRVYEKVYNRVVTGATAAGGAKAKIFTWAVRVGKRKVALEQAGKPVPRGLALRYSLATKLVFSKLQARMGGRIRVLVSGAAPLSVAIAEFFAAAGLPIMEGYGLTETSAGNFVNRPGHLKVGSVGQRLGDLECKLDTDGEILIRGMPVMRGYHNLPEETAAAFTEDGFFRTGDIGELDADGYLRITDRKKDLIKTSGGKYVAPSHIEGVFKALCPYTSQAIVVGQARNFCSMLVTLDPEAMAAWAEGGPLAGRPYAELVTSREAYDLVTPFVKELNTRLNRWETIKKFTILPRDLSIEDGELTPSMKVKRRAVESTFVEDIEKMYAGTVADL
jgi:long-chain acyl-CoA synthetase